MRLPPGSTLFPYTTLFRPRVLRHVHGQGHARIRQWLARAPLGRRDRKSTRLNSSHLVRSYAVFCLKKKNQHGRDAEEESDDGPWLFARSLSGLITDVDRADLFFFNDTAPTEIYTLSLHDALPICSVVRPGSSRRSPRPTPTATAPCTASSPRSEEHTSELQSPCNLVCRLLLE